MKLFKNPILIIDIYWIMIKGHKFTPYTNSNALLLFTNHPVSRHPKQFLMLFKFHYLLLKYFIAKLFSFNWNLSYFFMDQLLNHIFRTIISNTLNSLLISIICYSIGFFICYSIVLFYYYFCLGDFPEFIRESIITHRDHEVYN